MNLKNYLIFLRIQAILKKAVDGEKIGKIAVIGPTRMDYSKVLNSLDYIVDRIMECLSNDNIQEEKGGEDGRE